MCVHAYVCAHTSIYEGQRLTASVSSIVLHLVILDLFIYMCAHVCVRAIMMTHIRKLQDNFWGLVLSLSSPCGSQGLNSGYKDCLQIPLSFSPSLHFIYLFGYLLNQDLSLNLELVGTGWPASPRTLRSAFPALGPQAHTAVPNILHEY